MRSAGEKTSGPKGDREGQRLGKGLARLQNGGTEVRVTPEDVWGGAGKAQGLAQHQEGGGVHAYHLLGPVPHVSPESLASILWG